MRTVDNKSILVNQFWSSKKETTRKGGTQATGLNLRQLRHGGRVAGRKTAPPGCCIPAVRDTDRRQNKCLQFPNRQPSAAPSSSFGVPLLHPHLVRVPLAIPDARVSTGDLAGTRTARWILLAIRSIMALPRGTMRAATTQGPSTAIPFRTCKKAPPFILPRPPTTVMAMKATSPRKSFTWLRYPIMLPLLQNGLLSTNQDTAAAGT